MFPGGEDGPLGMRSGSVRYTEALRFDMPKEAVRLSGAGSRHARLPQNDNDGHYRSLAALGTVSGRRSVCGGKPSRPSGTASDQVYGGSIPGHSGGHPPGPRQ